MEYRKRNCWKHWKRGVYVSKISEKIIVLPRLSAFAEMIFPKGGMVAQLYGHKTTWDELTFRKI